MISESTRSMQDSKRPRKKRGKFNFVDVAMLLLILALVSTLAYVFVSPYTEQLFATKYNVEYTIRLTEVREEFRSNIKEGDSVVETESLSTIGAVTHVSSTRSVYTGVDAEGNAVASEHPYCWDVEITVRGEATLPEGVYSINGYSVTAGKIIAFRVPNFAGEGICTGIREVSGDEE